MHRGQRPHVADDLGQSFESVADEEERVFHAAVLDVGEHTHPELRPLTAAAHPQPEDVLLPGQRHSNRRIDRPVRHLPVADLHHDRVDEDRRVHLFQGPRGPFVHLLDDLVGDPRDRFLADRRAVDLREVRTDLTRGQPVRIQRQHDLLDPVQAALPLAHDLRLERPLTVPRDLDRDLTGRFCQHRLRSGPVAHVRVVTVRIRTGLLKVWLSPRPHDL